MPNPKADGTITGSGTSWVPGFDAPPPNQAPVAVPEAYSTPKNTAKVVSAGNGVLKNDTDGDGDPLTAVLVTNVTHGTLALAATGGFTYTPTAGYNGLDAFTYKANDGTDDSNTVSVSLAVGNLALRLGSSGAYVTMGVPTKLGLQQFTIETWFMRTGTGVASTTGTGGVANLVPLLTHGAAQAEGSTVDANWILGINTTGNVIAADFEGIDDPPTTGQNAPISGTTAITNDVWHHAAATFDGTTWSVYLDGNLEASVDPGFHPRWDSIQPVALGAMIQSGALGPTAGRFDGVIDEARVWDHARTVTEINDDKDNELTSGSGLVARWGLDDGSGTNVADSIDTVPNPKADGTITGSGTSWVPGFVPPAPPNVAPVAANDGFDVDQDTTFHAAAPGVLDNDTDADSDPLTAVLDATTTHGALTLHANGSFDYTPTTGYIGGDSFTYHANDGTDDSNIATVSLTVEPGATNEAPVAAGDSFSTPQDVTLNEAAPGVLGNDTDGDGDALSAVLDAGPTHGTLTLDPDGSFDYVPTAGYSGPDGFTYHANDGALDSSVATVALTVTPVAAAPPTVALDAPADGATGTTTSPIISVLVGDPNGGTVDVEFWGRTAASGNFAVLDSHAGVPVGSTSSTTWAGRSDGQRYEWYAKVTDGTTTVTSPTWTFNTAPGTDPVFVGAGDIADCGRTQDEADGRC